MILDGISKPPKAWRLAPTLGHFMPSGAGRANAAAENGHGIVGFFRHQRSGIGVCVIFVTKHMVRTLGEGISPPHWKKIRSLWGANLHPCVAYPSSRSNSELYKLLQGQGPVIFDASIGFLFSSSLGHVTNGIQVFIACTSDFAVLCCFAEGLDDQTPSVASVPCWLNNTYLCALTPVAMERLPYFVLMKIITADDCQRRSMGYCPFAIARGQSIKRYTFQHADG